MVYKTAGDERYAHKNEMEQGEIGLWLTGSENLRRCNCFEKKADISDMVSMIGGTRAEGAVS
jgi:hypothetical protein